MFLEVASMVVTWWIVAILRSVWGRYGSFLLFGKQVGSPSTSSSLQIALDFREFQWMAIDGKSFLGFNHVRTFHQYEHFEHIPLTGIITDGKLDMEILMQFVSLANINCDWIQRIYPLA